jgi:hypothetical protein
LTPSTLLTRWLSSPPSPTSRPLWPGRGCPRERKEPPARRRICCLPRPGVARYSPAAGQWIEAVFDTLKGQLTLEEHGGRTLAGVYARVAARLLALAAAIWHNWHLGVPIKRYLIAYDV